MQQTEIILDILNKRSKLSLEIKDIYRCLFNPEWYVIAYNKISNTNITIDTIDNNLLKRINDIINDLKFERFEWIKVDSNSIYYHKKIYKMTSKEWKNFILLKVLQSILEAIYEPRFLDCSHGNRKDKGIHTALTQIRQHSKSCEWFIKCEINNFYNSINHNILLDILKQVIKDGRFIELIRRLLKANILESGFIFNQTYSNTPLCNNNISLLLSNIYLHQFDKWVYDNLITTYNQDNIRPKSKEYEQISQKILRRKRKRKGNKDDLELLKEIKKLVKIRRKMSTKEKLSKCTYRRLSYTRYMNDWLITFTGVKSEADLISQQIVTFLISILNLSISNIKIINTSNTKKSILFVNYNLIIQNNDSKITLDKNDRKMRWLSGEVGFLIPKEVLNKYKKKYMRNNKVIHISNRIFKTDFEIIKIYQHEFKDIVQYYKFARNQSQLNYLKWIIETSMLKTLAAKFKLTVNKIVKKYKTFKLIDNYNYVVFQAKCQYKNSNKVYIVHFGGIPLKRQIALNENIIKDKIG